MKRPPGFNSVNNGVSGNTGGREYSNRASFGHGSDNAPMPIGPGYGRSNSISVIPQVYMVVVRRFNVSTDSTKYIHFLW